MRKNACLLTLFLLLMVGLAAAIFACGGSSSASSSTTATTVSETTTSAAATQDTTSSTEAGTTTTAASDTTTTELAPTTDTADHAADFRAQYPSTESFDNTTWATLSAAAASHLGATVDVKGQPSKLAVDQDSLYLTWELTVTGASGQQATVLCRTNVTVDRTLLTGSSAVEVKGIVVDAQAADAGGGPIIYVESVQKAG
jgi:hypothetical protein